MCFRLQIHDSVLLLTDEEEIDFEGFVRIIRASSADSLDNLDQYDARLPKTPEYVQDNSQHSA